LATLAVLATVAFTASAGPLFPAWFLAAISVPHLLERAVCYLCCH
jgi:hypothetical protein